MMGILYLPKTGFLTSMAEKRIFPALLTRTIILILMAATLGWTVLVHLDMPVLPYDDAFITFRYVKNFFEGNGLVYNPGQRVFGSSSPLYLFWLIVIKFFSQWSIPHLAVRFNALHLVSAALALYFLLKKVTGNRLVGLLGGLTFLVNPIGLFISGGGMESFLFVTMILLTLISMADDKPLRAGIFGGLSVLARPDGLLLLPVLWARFRKGPKDWKHILMGFSFTLLPWIIFSWLYFGTPIPLSLMAKAKPLFPLPRGEALRSINAYLTYWTTPFGEGQSWLRTVMTWGLLLGTSWGIFYGWKANIRFAWPGVGLFWLLILVYGIGNPLFFSWYWPHLFVLTILVEATGFYFLGNLLVRSAKRMVAFLGGLVWLAGICCLIYPTVRPYVINKTGVPLSKLFVLSEPSRWRILAYEQAAEVLNREALASDTVAAPEVGALGFYFKGRIYDACGLVSPEAHPFLPVPIAQRAGPQIGAISTDFVRQVDPGWVVSMPVFSFLSLARSDWFKKHYDAFKEIPLMKSWLGDRAVIIYKKRKL